MSASKTSHFYNARIAKYEPASCSNCKNINTCSKNADEGLSVCDGWEEFKYSKAKSINALKPCNFFTAYGLISERTGSDLNKEIFFIGTSERGEKLEGLFNAEIKWKQNDPLIIENDRKWKTVDSMFPKEHAFERWENKTFYGTVYFVDGVVLGPGVYKSGPYYWMLEYDKPANLVKKGK